VGAEAGGSGGNQYEQLVQAIEQLQNLTLVQESPKLKVIYEHAKE